jgi:hypothetical protein
MLEGDIDAVGEDGGMSDAYPVAEGDFAHLPRQARKKIGCLQRRMKYLEEQAETAPESVLNHLKSEHAALDWVLEICRLYLVKNL